jgi:hypothetical protein
MASASALLSPKHCATPGGQLESSWELPMQLFGVMAVP